MVILLRNDCYVDWRKSSGDIDKCSDCGREMGIIGGLNK